MHQIVALCDRRRRETLRRHSQIDQIVNCMRAIVTHAAVVNGCSFPKIGQSRHGDDTRVIAPNRPVPTTAACDPAPSDSAPSRIKYWIVCIVAEAKQQPAIGTQPIAPGSADLLIVMLDVLRQIDVQNPAHIRLIDTHAEGDSRHNYRFIITDKRCLIALTRRGVWFAVIR